MTRHIFLISLSILLLAGCALPDRSGSEGDQTLVEGVDEATWRDELLAYRADKDEEFANSATSPMAGMQYLKSEPRDLVFLAREGQAFELAYETREGGVLEVEKRQDSWHWGALEAGVDLEADEEETANPGNLDGPALFSVGDFHLSLYPAEDRVTFIVFDPERPEMSSFKHLEYYPPDVRYAVSARLTELETPEKIVMLTSRSLEKTFYRFAWIQFEIDGEERRLTAFKTSVDGDGSSETLFVPFRDATSGAETYGAGRFIEIEMPAEQPFTFDFNRAFSPLCNYSPAYNCAIPPRENHLEVAIMAGEKTYPH